MTDINTPIFLIPIWYSEFSQYLNSIMMDSQWFILNIFIFLYYYIYILLGISRSNISLDWFCSLRFPLSPQSEEVHYITPGRSESCWAFKHWRNSFSDWNQNLASVAMTNIRIKFWSCSTQQIPFPDLLWSLPKII